MKYATLKMHEDTYYYILDYNDNGLYKLAEFLATSIISDVNYYLFTNWLKDKYSKGSIEGQIYALTNYNDKILGHFCYFIEEKEPYGEDPCLHFEISREELLRIIDEWIWIVVQKPKPKEIIITQDDINQLTIKGVEPNEVID